MKPGASCSFHSSFCRKRDVELVPIDLVNWSRCDPQHLNFFAQFLHLLPVCIHAGRHETADSCRKCFDALHFFMSRLTTWLLILGSYASATGQTGLPEASSSPNWQAGLFWSVEQRDKDRSPQASPQALRTLLTAKTVFIVGETLDPTSRAEQILKKALAKWGRFELVDDAETA